MMPRHSLRSALATGACLLAVVGSLSGCSRHEGTESAPSDRPSSSVSSWLPQLPSKLDGVNLADPDSVLTDGTKALLSWDPSRESDPLETIQRSRPLVNGDLFTDEGYVNRSKVITWETGYTGRTWAKWAADDAKGHVTLKDISSSDNAPKDTDLDKYRTYIATVSMMTPSGKTLSTQQFIVRVQASKYGYWQLVFIQCEPAK